MLLLLVVTVVMVVVRHLVRLGQYRVGPLRFDVRWLRLPDCGCPPNELSLKTRLQVFHSLGCDHTISLKAKGNIF